MNTKLTLRMDEFLIESAKEYSARTGKSLSRIVADFFRVIIEEKLEEEYQITPIVKSLTGILKESSLDKNDYKKHLEEKYL